MKTKISKQRCLKGMNRHWDLPEPNGRKTTGVCRYCKKKQIHYNSHNWSQWQAGRNHHGYTKPNPAVLKSIK